MLRKAKFEDIFEIKKLIDLGATEGKVLRRSAEELAGVISSFFVWEENHQIVGCASLEVYSPKLAEIRSLVVLDNFRGKGIASQLVKACLEEAKTKDVYEILAITDKDVFFDKLGFKKELDNQFPMFYKVKDRS